MIGKLGIEAGEGDKSHHFQSFLPSSSLQYAVFGQEHRFQINQTIMLILWLYFFLNKLNLIVIFKFVQ